MRKTPGWTQRLNVRHLQLLVSLAEVGSLSDTARATSTSQPALSKWLKELEDAVGSPLFDRHARGLSPTAHGEILLAHARRVINEMGRAQYNLAVLEGGATHPLMLGATPPSAAELVPTALAAFLREREKTRVGLIEESMSPLLEKLVEGKLDVVVGGLDNYEPTSNVRSEVLHSESTRVVARPGHPLARRKKLSWDDLAAYDWIVWPQGTPVRARLDMALTRAGRGPLPYRIESSSLTANFALLQDSDMLCAVSSRLARYFARRGQVATLAFQLDAENPIGMCWRDESLQDVSVRAMLNCLRRAAGGKAI